MLSGEGNENGEKTTIGLNSKEATLHVQQTFFVHFFAVVLHDYKVKSSRNFLVNYTFYGGNVVRVVLFTFCFHCRSFLPYLIFSPPLQNFQKMSSCFLSLALALCRSFSR